MIISIGDHIRLIIHIIHFKHMGIILNKSLQEAAMVLVGSKGLLACMVHPNMLVVMITMVDKEAIFLITQCLPLLPFLHMLPALPLLLLWVQSNHR